MRVDVGLFAPEPVALETGESVEAVRRRIEAALDAESVPGVIPADGGAPGLSWVGGAVTADGVVAMRARRVAPAGSASVGLALAFDGRLVDVPGGGARLEGAIAAPVHRGLWLVPAVGFVLAVAAGAGGRGLEAIGWLALTVVLTAAIRWSQRDALRDAPQLRLALERLVRG